MEYKNQTNLISLTEREILQKSYAEIFKCQQDEMVKGRWCGLTLTSLCYETAFTCETQEG